MQDHELYVMSVLLLTELNFLEGTENLKSLTELPDAEKKM
jgi:hypothetical protein